MSYALDVNNQRVRVALEALGVDKEELLIKTINDFGHKGVREEIKQLRYDYYSRRLEETVKCIKEAIKSMATRAKADNHKSFTACTDDGTSIPTLSEKSLNDRKVFLNEKNKDTLLIALEEIKNSLTTIEKKERPKSMVRPRTTKAPRFDHFKKTQQENFTRIKETEERQARKALSQSFHLYHQNKASPKAKDPKVLTKTLKKTLSVSNSDVEINEKLYKYDEKIEKSRALHEKQILMKKESARNHPSATKLETLNNDELIFKIIERTRAVSERKDKKVEKIKEKWEKVKNFKEEKVHKLKKLEKEYRKAIHEKEEILEHKLNSAEKIIKNRKASVGKEIEIKIEVQKLKYEDANIKVKRANKMMKHKREMIINKQKEDNMKFEVTKQIREIANNKKRDQAIQKMIEKERVNEVLRIIKKSPKSKVAFELLKEFDMMPEKNETSED
ncbi:hypothetical protein SteCoe_8011 [Stentor coeruleus]|uniref:Uncharacterized protein n=1 Tax=Stentor coeruleus TaxID=5963 RepID=A0A1R2CL48_9CILI|nr:hypothetical protein SteCoe_8011 [Stentor coeruleus]